MTSEEMNSHNPIDWIGNKKVTVEIGIGHRPGISVLDRKKDTSRIRSGEELHVSIDEEVLNLGDITAGAAAHMDMFAFAYSDFLDGKVSSMYIFNVFGEPDSSASIAGFSEPLLNGLKKKLKSGGEIVIGEHISPEKADFLRDVGRLRSMGFVVEHYVSPHAIEALLTHKYDFTNEYARAFVGQSEENKQWRGNKAGGFLLILKKP